MTRAQISLDPDFYEYAKQEARRRGISFAELVRRYLLQMLGPEEDDRPWMRYAGAFDSGDPSASSTIDEVGYGRWSSQANQSSARDPAHATGGMHADTPPVHRTPSTGSRSGRRR